MRLGGSDIRFREVSDSAEWNAAVKALDGSIAQSWEWGLFHQREGWQPLRLLDEGGRGAVQLLLKDASRGSGAVAYAPYGPLPASPSDLAEVTESAARWVRGRGTYLLKIEPRVGVEATREILKAGGKYVQAGRELPVRTRIVSILNDPDEHLMALPKDGRYCIRRAQRVGVEVLTLSSGSPDIDIEMEKFLKLLKDTSKRHGFYMAPEEFYTDVMRDLPTHLLLACHEGTPVAGAIIATFGEEAYYLFGASTPEKGNLYASYLLQWKAMEVARRAGCSRYDMWGISSRSSSRTEGFIRFKKKFGGSVEEYPGAYLRVLNYPQLLKHGAAPLVARGARFAIRRYPGARGLGGKKASVQRDADEFFEEQAGSSSHQSTGRRQRLVKQLITLGVYFITSAAYARAFASSSLTKPFGEPVAGPRAPFIGNRYPAPPNVIAGYRRGARP